MSSSANEWPPPGNACNLPRLPHSQPLIERLRSLLWRIPLLAFAVSCLAAIPAGAIPSFAQQTGQPCAACHVGAFGPQLKQFGRDFKLNGYVANDGQDHGPPIAVTSQLSFTRTNADQGGPAAAHFAANDNLAADQTSLYYAGRIAPWLGAFAQATYDGVGRQFRADNVDVRQAGEGTLFGTDLVYGLTANNAPTVTDIWNSTPSWGFPYNRSQLAPTPIAAALIDGGLSQRVAGGGAYMMWNELIYLEADLYRGLGYDVRNALGAVPVSGTDKAVGAIPYWRLAVNRRFGRHYLEFGAYGISANIAPGGVKLPGTTDRFTDNALDANYQFVLQPLKVTSDMVSAHATLIHETGNLGASELAVGSLRRHILDTFRADVSYSIADTVTPTLQYFWTGGTRDPAYYGTTTGRPNSSGIVAEIAYVPWGKPEFFISWGNIRFALQYIDYFHFDGARAGADAKNTLYASVWLAAHF